jgi:hypothetical protein
MAVTKYDVMPMTYLNWVLLWINAIKDSYLWVDSPDCFFFKVDHIFWNHDLNSTLKKANWQHRFNSTISTVDSVIWNNNSLFEDKLEFYANNDFVKVLFVSSMPMAQVIWADYQMIIDNAINKTWKKNIYNIPSRSMTSCWLDWYSDFLFSLAKNIDLEWWIKDNKKVAIVWNLFDRNEWDCIWNIKELKNIFEWLWLEVESIWLDWWEYDDILKIKNAWTIISLPYWRKAAKKIAKRLDVEVLELDIPFWFNWTIDFIKSIWEYFNIDNNIIKKFIDNEFIVRNDITILKWAINKTFFNKKISYYWDPYLLNWIIDISEYIWLDINQLFLHWEKKHLLNNLNTNYESNNEKIEESLLVDRNLDLDLFIINSSNWSYWIPYWDGQQIYDNKKIMEFWFPSYWYHCFTEQPYYWIRWAINFINRIFNKLNM